MKKQCLILAALTLLVITSLAFARNNNNQHMHFRNKRGSILNITLHKDSRRSGRVMGTFKTAVASKNCRNVIGKPQPVIGYYTGNAIAFTVSYPSCGAALAVVGNFNAKNNIETLWLDAHQGKHTNGADWNTRYIGYDKFKLQH